MGMGEPSTSGVLQASTWGRVGINTGEPWFFLATRRVHLAGLQNAGDIIVRMR